MDCSKMWSFWKSNFKSISCVREMPLTPRENIVSTILKKKDLRSLGPSQGHCDYNAHHTRKGLHYCKIPWTVLLKRWGCWLTVQFLPEPNSPRNNVYPSWSVSSAPLTSSDQESNSTGKLKLLLLRLIIIIESCESDCIVSHCQICHHATLGSASLQWQPP